MTGTRTALVVLTLAGAAACVGGTDTPAVTVWDAQLSAALAHPDVGGTAAAVSDPTGTSVSVLLTGAEPGAAHEWSISIGSCADPGTQFGPSSDYPVLAVDPIGHAEADTHLGPRLSLDETYYIEIRESADDDTRVACGNLIPR